MIRRGLAAVLAVLMFASCVFAAGGNLPGSGTEGDPYLIEDLADFDEFADVENADKYWDEGVYTKLESDLDLDPNLPGRVIYAKAPIAGYLGEEFYWEYGGILSFSGVFDGNCHIISNMIIEGEDYCGLFGRIGGGGKVFDLGLHNVKIEGYDYCGGLCGENSGSIARSYVRGSVYEFETQLEISINLGFCEKANIEGMKAYVLRICKFPIN